MAVTEWKRAGSVVEDTAGTIVWTGEANLADGGTGSATFTGAAQFTTTKVIDASDFSKQFGIPAGATINGVEVRFVTSGGSGSSVLSGFSMVDGDDNARADQAGGEQFVGDDVIVLGGSTDLLGLDADTDFLNTNVGFRWQLTNLSDSNGVTLDAMEMRVHYRPPVTTSSRLAKMMLILDD